MRGVIFRSFLVRRGGVLSCQNSSSVEATFCLFGLGGGDTSVSEIRRFLRLRMVQVVPVRGFKLGNSTGGFGSDCGE